MNKKAVEQLSQVVTSLRENRFETLSEAAIFCAAARATVDGTLSGVTEISRATKLPNSTVSRLVWDLNRRGLLEYETDVSDRRVKRVRAKLDAFK
jgi:DNA-binding MarR family transcriptional regulator